MGSREEFDNIEGLDEAFLKEIDTLAARADLANIPTNFYTFRVQSANNEYNEAGLSRRLILGPSPCKIQ